LGLLGAKSVTGVDYSDSGLALAHELAERYKLSNVSFKKASILELPFDDESFDLWRKAGIPQTNLVWVEGHKNFVYLAEDGEQAGPRCEIYFDMTNQLSTPQYLEIGTTVFETHKFSSKDGRLVPIKNFIFGNAFGIERLAMVSSKSSSVYQVDTIAPLVEIVTSHLSSANLARIFEDDVHTVADHVRAIMFAIMDGQEPDNSGRGKVLKKLIRNLTTRVKLLYIEIRVKVSIIHKTMILDKILIYKVVSEIL